MIFSDGANPYHYTEPPIGVEMPLSPTKLRVTARALSGGSINGHRSRKTNHVLGVFIGIVLGFILTAVIRHIMLDPNICLSPRNVLHFETNDPSRIFGLEKSKDGQTKGNNLIFVGVMTANKYLDTRAKAVYETWGKLIPGKIAFFSSETSSTTADIPLIRLPGVDDSYPPQKKSFMMLKYMHENLHDHFEYFMRADDDVFVRPDKLENFLRSINSSNKLFIGQAGRGNPDEFGHLSLKTEENFCMGGPGIIMSRKTLGLLAPHAKDCLKNLRSTHEDVEIGRCVQKYVGIPCTWSYEVSLYILLFQNMMYLYVFYP